MYNNIVSKKKIIIISVSVSVLALMILSVCLFLVFYFKPKPAGNVEAIISAHNIVVKAETADEDRTYKFKFSSDDGELIVDSNSHIKDVTHLFWQGKLKLGKEYSLSVAYVEKTGILAGKYGEPVKFTATLKLDNPQLVLEGNMLSWQPVQGADGYLLYYNDGKDLIEIQANSPFDISQIKGGERQIYVIATSSNEYLTDSDKSQTVSATVYHPISKIAFAYIAWNRKVTIRMNEKVDAFVVKVGEKEYSILTENMEVVFNDNGYTYNFDATFIFTGEEMTISPMTDEYNSYAYEPTIVESR